MAVVALPPVVLAAIASGGSSPVISQSTVTRHSSAIRARSTEENRRAPLSDFDIFDSSRPIRCPKARRLSPDASIRFSTRSATLDTQQRLAPGLRKSQVPCRMADGEQRGEHINVTIMVNQRAGGEAGY